MKHSLQLRLSQHLTLTPQLQQSIRLLQLSTLELDQELERFLRENPLLERDDGVRVAPPQERERTEESPPSPASEVANQDEAVHAEGADEGDAFAEPSF